MGKAYQVCDAKDSRKLAAFLAKEGQWLLPMLDLVTRAEAAVDEVIEVVGRATLEAILLLSAQEVAGPRHPGRVGGQVRRHGRQGGVVTLSDRRVRLEKPRLRKKGPGVGAEHPTAAASLREGLEETFTVNALGLPAALRRCLATTNLIESPQSGVRQRTRRVTRW